MNKDYQRIISALDKLSPAELVALMNAISTRLQAHVGEIDDDPITESEDAPRRYLPRLPQMIAWGLVVPMEDTLYVRDIQDQPALLLDANRVAFHGTPMSLNDWAKAVTSWKAVNIYEFVVVKRTGKTLDDMRRAYMAENRLE